MIQEMVCIVCPIGCHLKAEVNEKNEVISVTGNSCKRGEEYARRELTNPVRMITGTVKINNGIHKRLPVVSSQEIPKDMMEEVMAEIRKVSVTAPVKMNDVLIQGVCGLSVDILAERSMPAEERETNE